MNAFAGYISLNNTAVSPETLDLMATNLVNYKPDQKHIFGSPQACFAQLIRYNTPESFYETPYTNFVHDIRLDNREELASLLGIQLNAQMPDSFLVLKAYQRWDSDCLKYLLGDFAFAIWEHKRQTLFCARDQMGQRLLYYYYLPNQFFIFSSVISGLLALPEVEHQLNHDKFSDALTGITSKPEDTVYRNIFRLKAATSLKLEHGNIGHQTYWTLKKKPVRFKKDSDYLEAFLEIFRDSIHCRLRSAFPIGAHLSGGLDSSSVVAIAAQELTKLITFSAFPPLGHHGPDDTHYVQMMCRQYPNLESIIVRSESRNLFSKLEEIYPYLDAPRFNFCNLTWLHEILDEASQKQIRVLLVGYAGNSTISYAGRTLKHRLARLLKVPSQWWGKPWLDVEQYSAIAPHRIASQRDILEKEHCYFIDPIAESLLKGDPDGSGLSQAERSYWGIEYRDPTCDQRLVEFCFGLPNKQFFQDGSHRMLIRRAMQGLLPEALRVRTSIGQQLPQWPDKINASYQRITQEWAGIKNSNNVRDLIDIARIDHLLAAWPKADHASENTEGNYRCLLLPGFFVARFIKWMEHGKRT